jgi:hypothetical protein
MPLPIDIIRDQIKGMSEDIRRQVVEQIKGTPAKMGLQLSESTDVSNCGKLLDFLGTCIRMKSNKFYFVKILGKQRRQ